MKIVVLGHSNSILGDGWLSHLKSIEPSHRYVNLSIGGSPSPALLYQAVAYADQLAGAELVIVEPTVVDHGEDWQSGASVAGQAAALAGWLESSVAAHVLLLVLPRTPEWCLTPSQGMQAWHAVARRHRMSVIDGRMALLRHCSSAGIELDAAWRDHMGHTVSEAQREVARDISTWIREFAATGDSSSFSTSIEVGFRVIGGSALCRGQEREALPYQTSLMSVECLRMYAGDRVPVGTAPTERVHGLAVNFGSFDPVAPVTLRAYSADGRSSPFKVGNPFLGAGPSGRLILMFAPVRIDHDVAYLEIDDADSKRFAAESHEGLEIAGILIGPAIEAAVDWRTGAHLLEPLSA